ncbi:uncharacterized protein LOC108473743 [Gossypium arboreum]|uniref:uncharacterized protein LOC108473743 n=1 Tax=Gossypium arboreum TaxID=29729 RepID=UPI0008194EE1|nr:uncharacterized protein LOC108473743 [Gossypium arboreum]
MGRGKRAPGRGTGSTEVRQPTLVYATSSREDKDASDVIMDIGSIHSYIASTVSETLSIPVESTSSEVTVASSLGESIQVSKLFRNVPLEIQGIVFQADLMELSFGEFDLILGMDWLVKHRVSLDCGTKRVVLRTDEDNELVRKGCEAFLAYVSISDSRDSFVKDIKTVRDFSNVFPEELSGLPPSREVELGIELIPGIAPVFIAPYRMALKELVELKT